MESAPRILVLLGTRPEAIKLAPVVAALRERSGEARVAVVATGQHEDLLDDALGSLELEIDENLGIMRRDQDLYDVGIYCLEGLRPVMRRVDPSLVIVQGDTATAMYGALAGYYQRVRVAHVEAGLRSGDKWAPFPEEIFRRIADVLSDYYFAPTPLARDHLVAEGVTRERISVTGNTVVDAVLALAARGGEPHDPALREALDSGRRMVLVTVHRRESFGEPLRQIFGALRELAETHPGYAFVYPVHPNPNVSGPARETLAGLSNFRLIDPLSYSDMVHALSRSWVAFTDSGGIQEEAPSFGVPVVVLRRVTERPEGIDAGVARLAGTERETIVRAGKELLGDDGVRRRMSRARNPYGDGRAGKRIADILISDLLGVPRQTEDWS